MRERSFLVGIFLVSLAAIVLEIGYTRIFSFKLYYYFTYLILGIALLGLGSGGVLVTLSERLRRAAPEDVVAASCLLAAISVPASYFTVALVQLNTVDLADHLFEWVKLAAICLALFVPFLFVGVALATILGSDPERVDRLYFADLVGAGLGCALCVPLFRALGPPGAVMLSGLVLAVAAGYLVLRHRRSWLPLAAASIVTLLVLVAAPKFVPDPTADRIKSMSPQQGGSASPLFSSWSAVFRIDVIEGMTPEKNYLIAHDGIMGSIIHRFDGDWASLSAFDTSTRALPFSVLPPQPRVLVIGAAGGHELLASLYFDASKVVGVELNPVTVSLLRDRFADYSGRIVEDPRVDLVNAEGRSYLTRDQRSYDLIWFVAPDSYSALNAASSGAFVLSESYLYTVEMLEEALSHLTSDGILCVQFGEVSFDHKPNRTTRFLATARRALGALGIEDFDAHVLMSTAPGIFTHATVLLKATPFEAAWIERFREANAAIEGANLLHAGGEGSVGPRHPVHEVISRPLSELPAWIAAYPYDVSPVTDDAPFFWHFARFRDAALRPWGEATLIWDPEDATGERMLLVLLAFAALFAAVFLLLPMWLARGSWSEIPHKGVAAVYFACLGLGFMFFEVCLIQKLTLFLGYPTYSLTVTLFGLLIFSGIGSLGSRRWRQRRRTALRWLLGAVVLLTLFYQFGLGPLASGLAGIPFAARVLVALAVLAPLGLCLGAFMPLGLHAVASLGVHEREYVAWAWAVNGFFSVVSSVLATVLSMSFGFRAVLLLAALIYALAVVALSRLPEPGAPARGRVL